ncbi:sodium:solute symporter family protein [Synergistaceae bacterium OttesenSCG-928-D05]|nr:sodium:solute symporter family protein [Synergistaceae bacterium OttesenSCG-928-D05]
MLSFAGSTVVVVYFLGLLFVGWLLRNLIATEEDFYLAGRRLTLPLAMSSIMATWYGAGGTIGCAELAFLYGISVWFSWSIGAHVARIPLAIWVAPKVRRIAGTTLPDLMEKIYNRKVAYIAMLLILVSAARPQHVRGLGIIGQAAWGMSPELIMLIAIVIVCLYTLLGGMWSVTITDVVQFFMMTAILVIFLPFTWREVGGFKAMFETLPPELFHPTKGMPMSQFIVFFLMGLMVYADPLFYQRFAAADKPSSARRALLICIAFWPCYDSVYYLLGMLARVRYPDLAPGMSFMTLMIMNTHPIVGGIFIAALLAAVMSTLDSTFLVGGMTLSHDLYARLKPNATQKELLFMSQLGVFLTGAAGYIMALKFKMVADGMVFLMTLWTAAAFVPVIGGLFWPYKKTNFGGGAAFLVGFILMIFFQFIFKLPKPLTPFLVAFPASFVAFIIGNMFGEHRSNDLLEA